MFIYEGTNNLVSGAFLKCFSIAVTFINSAIDWQVHHYLSRVVRKPAVLDAKKKS